VNEEGFVSDVQVVMGHPILSDAAIAAVKQWQYSPTLLNGEPVPVIATVTVVFAIKGDQAETGSGSTAPSIPQLPPMASSRGFAMFGLDGAVFYSTAPIDEKGSLSPYTLDFRPPELPIISQNILRWQKIAADLAKGTPLTYSFIVDETGQIANFARVQGPEIPDIERELSQMRASSPGLRGSTLVRSWCMITIGVGMTKDEVQKLYQSFQSNFPKP
jgi:hypothetical protein